MVVKVIYILMIILENVEWFDGYFEERGKVMGLLGFLEIFIFWLCLDNIDCMDEGMYKCVICDELVFGNEVEWIWMSIVESKCNFININVIEYNFKIKFEDLRIYLKCLCVYYS